MKNKGFTLIELLGYIVILTSIALIAYPSILKFLGTSQDKIDDSKKTLIITAAKEYVNDNINNYKKTDTLSKTIKTKTLIEEGYITNREITKDENLNHSCTLVKTNTNNYIFEFKTKENCDWNKIKNMLIYSPSGEF